MRADRLISILMLLQARGRMTARALAEELEVSERTIYRDMEALSASGVPLYAESGPGGGLALLDSYRTNLTGLDEGELRALFMIFSAPGPLEKLGASKELRSAMQKFSAALPDSRRSSEEQVQQRFYLDWSWWFHAGEQVPHLSTIRQAVWEDRRLRLSYRTYLLISIEVEVEPYGLVAKAGAWYLVGCVEGQPQVYRVSWLSGVQPLEARFTRRRDFNLAEYWQRWCGEYEELQHAYLVTLRVSPQLMKVLPLYFGRSLSGMIAQAGAPDEQGWVTLTLPFESLENARDRILSFGAAAEVLEPEALRCSLVDFARQIVSFYDSAFSAGSSS
jgi:predicted DNA-binding transcriptional regulator YafY